MLGSGDILVLASGTEARIGLIVANDFGDLFALTTRDFLAEADETLSVQLANQTAKAGVVGDRSFSESIAWQGARALSWFAIDTSQLVRAETLETYNFVDPDQALNTDVFLESRDGRRHEGYVRRVATSLQLSRADHAGYEVRNRILEVAALDSNEPFGEFGDAGALVLTESNEILGLLVGFRKGRTLVAPIFDFFKAEKFKIATLEQISRHNESVKEENFEEQFLHKIAASERSWSDEVRSLANRSNAEFSHLRHAIGLSAMERCQDNIAQAIFDTVGAHTFVEELFNLRFENDAPGRHPNENWLWRAIFERVRLLDISTNKRCFIVNGTKEEICPVTLVEDSPVIAPTDQYDNQGSFTKQVFADLTTEEKASLLFGENEIETKRAIDWVSK